MAKLISPFRNDKRSLVLERHKNVRMYLNPFQIIEVRKDPSSKTELKGKATMKYGAPKVKNVTSQKSEELLRVARKVNARLKNSILEVEKEIREALEILKECGMTDES